MPQRAFHKGNEFQAVGCEVHSNCTHVPQSHTTSHLVRIDFSSLGMRCK